MSVSLDKFETAIDTIETVETEVAPRYPDVAMMIHTALALLNQAFETMDSYEVDDRQLP